MRLLTVAQHNRLDRIALEDPLARVVDWDAYGPVVRLSDGRLQVVTPMGRVNPRRKTS